MNEHFISFVLSLSPLSPISSLYRLQKLLHDTLLCVFFLPHFMVQPAVCCPGSVHPSQALRSSVPLPLPCRLDLKVPQENLLIKCHSINAVCNTPNIWTSYLYYDSPRYVAAFGVDLAASVLTIAFAALTYLYLRRQNRKIERGDPLPASGPSVVQIEAGFKYQL